MSGWSGSLNAFYRKKIVAASSKIAARTCGVDFDLVSKIQRKAPVAFARQLAMYLCHVVADMSLRDVAQEFRRDRTTVSHACHAIEDRRECPIFDRQIEHLENELQQKIRDMIVGDAKSRPLIEKKSLRLFG